MKIKSPGFFPFLLISFSLIIGSCKKTVEDQCAVSDQTTKSITTTTATLHWHGTVPPYGLQYRKTGTSTWTSSFSPDDSLQLRSLAPSTSYEWQVKSACGSNFSSSTTFTTNGCDPGYEGANCSTETRAKYLGTFYGNEVCTIGTDNYPLTVSASSTGILKVYFTNIYNQPFQVEGTLSDSTFTIPTQSVGSAGSMLSGTGSFHTGGGVVTMALTYTITPSTGSPNTCTYTGTH